MIPARYHSVIRPKAIVMGVSWGAIMAAEAAALDDIVAVVLVTPPLGNDPSARPLLQSIQGRVAFALARDDKVVDFAATKQQLEAATSGRDVVWIEVDAGGQGVAPSFVLPLVEFAESARELFVHGGEL
mmetsp:Transcript_57/g.109  ORF Transcript_57/g.109 Transcript_57/m.109 type:complete len:129 (+) Transcript_57:3-389(+)